ncbi:hypothetical protein GF361_02205 [Candidatus Woesearchaeota archaeon]|nr:hypothetical protein [Candidatus Woesearchaeota archaeon]
MKHSLKITVILVVIFLLSQLIGLAIVNQYIDKKTTVESGEPVYDDLPFGITRPEFEGTGGAAVFFIMFAILLGTFLVLFLVKYGNVFLWKAWFFIAVSITLVISLSAFINQILAAILALILAGYKVIKPNFYIHNITELFIYGGLAAIFVSLFKDPSYGVYWAFALLVVISIYDMIAVWKSKHMISLAKFQSKSKVFAGLLIPYKKVKRSKPIKKMPKKIKLKKQKIKTAVLGGGDIGFPLIFAGAVMANLMVTNPVWLGFLKAMLISVFASIGLLILLIKSKKNRFYPAMPFISAGCLAGYGVLLLINLLI